MRFTLILTMALVAMVIFLFLRKLWATVILVERLRTAGQLEDCLLAGRNKCDALLDEP